MPRADSISRQVSIHAVMTTILQKGPISRAGISRATGLSKQTSSEIVRLLEDAGWIQETGTTKGRVGRSAVLYQVVPDSSYIIGVDLGGTKVTAAIADMTCSIVAEATQTTRTEGGQQVVEQIIDLCRQLADEASIAWDKIRLGVVGLPGVVDTRTGFVGFAPNIPGFDTLPIKDALAEGLGFELVVENDVNLAVLGERWQGAGQGFETLAFIALGTGIGQGLIVNGNLVRGARGGAGEIGYLPLGSDPFSEVAKSVGALEASVGSHAMLRRYKNKGGRADTVRGIFDMAEAGEMAALDVLDDTASVLALGVAATAALFDPEKVIFGGSIGGRRELVDRVRTVLPTCMREPVPVETSALGRRAAIVGALAVGLQELHRTTYGAKLVDSEIAVPYAMESAARGARS